MTAKPVYIAEPSPLTLEDHGIPHELKKRTTKVEASKFIVGWREWMALPDLKIPGIKAKIDTGARTSALHTHDYEIFDKDGKEWVRFHLHPLVKSTKIELACEAPVSDYREVKDSGGHIERRPFIHTTGRMASFEWRFEVSLTNRESMKFRMLLGRTALSGLFVVDPQSSYIMGSSLRHKYPKRAK
jgi:hypothetical protein